MAMIGGMPWCTMRGHGDRIFRGLQLQPMAMLVITLSARDVSMNDRHASIFRLRE